MQTAESDPTQVKQQTSRLAARDYPFYNNKPVAISARGWALVLVLVALGFAGLTSSLPFYGDISSQIVPPLLFVLLSLIGLALVAGSHWRALFFKVTLKDVGWMVLIALANLAVTLVVALLVQNFLAVKPNAAIEMLLAMDSPHRAMFFIKTIPQLMGEELITILPFLAIVQLCTRVLHWKLLPAVTLAWLLTAIMFGMLHLPTYQWNWLQCIIIIGSARLVLTLAYIKTKNLWTSFGAHVINDWALFSAVILGATQA
ncbi:CPBP family intramembrane glutamic endopeptidase [uncultured Gilvimarinus sp.]|uniref:CPBP family intramembrane glutamic endopeptidase n=1 Tax=uncultured Gilvimarinus sp. TaxID=1689143 RepID=UPI0030EC03F7|tara:strand:- start:1043 stop:1816 length:774 start_codon:yes stop_codon:yes gene_type:complete